jgi:hypothetical protein
MTIQQDAMTRKATDITPQQVIEENNAAAVAAGFTQQEIEGASDNIDTVEQAAEAKKSITDQVREHQAAQAKDSEDFLASIAERRRAHLREGADDSQDLYGLDIEDENQDNQEQEVETEVEQEAQVQQEAAPQVDKNAPRFFTDESGNQKVELLVNGKVQVVDASRVIAAAQKLEAGDERLRQAAEERQRLERERAELEQLRLASQQNQQLSSADADPDLKAKLRQGFERLYNEGDDSALDDLVETLAKGRQPTTPQIDPNLVAEQAVVKLNQKAWDHALQVDAQAYETDPAYADVVGNPTLSAKATQYAQQLVRETKARDNNISPREIMNRAAEMARNEARELAAALGYTGQQVTTTQQVNSRAAAVDARKSQVGQTVLGSGAQRASEAPKKAAVPDGGKSPSSMDAKLAAFAGLTQGRTAPAIKR